MMSGTTTNREPGTYECSFCGKRHKWVPGQSFECPEAKAKTSVKANPEPLPPKLLEQIEAAGLPKPVTEHHFHPTRKWRLDIAWPELMICVECDGGVFTQGRHTRGEGYTKDCRKLNAAATMGWTVLRFTTPMIRGTQWEESEALRQIREAIRVKMESEE